MISGLNRIIRVLKRQNGVSLIEVLVAVTILGIIAIPFSSVFMQTFKLSNDSNMKSIASQTAVKYMEKYKKDSSVPVVQTDEAGVMWVPLHWSKLKESDTATGLKIDILIDVVDETDVRKYSLTDSNTIKEGKCPPQSLYKITVKVYSANDLSKEIISVTGLKRGI